MDLTSLSSTLPNQPMHAPHEQHPLEAEAECPPAVRDAFKEAALSVTNLYRSSQAQIQESRQQGYTDGYAQCLEDVLKLQNTLDGRGSDHKTVEAVRQWALGQKRRRHPGSQRKSPKRSEREGSSDSDSMERHQRPRSTSPNITLANTSTAPAATNPPHPSPRSPRQQVSEFTFRTAQAMPRVPPRLSSDDMDIADSDLNSPPTSPKFSPHTIFQIPGPFGDAVGGRHTLNRTGNKRGRYASGMDSIFDAAAFEKMDKMHPNKKGRYR